MVSDGKASHVWPAVQGMHLSAAGRAACILTGERLQDLYRVGRRRGLHARVRGGSLRTPMRAGDRFQRETALRFERQPGFAREAAGTQQLWRSGSEGAEHFADIGYAQYARAREALAEHWADEILEIADDATNDWMGRQRRDGVTEIVLNRDHVERSKQRIDARKWLLSKALPKVYGDRQSVEGKFTVDWAEVCQQAADRWKKEEGG